jgi:hypothetical protein
VEANRCGNRQEDTVKGLRIGTVASLIVVAALDLAFIRALPTPFLLVPFIAVLFAALNLVLVQILVVRRPLGPYAMGFVAAGLLYGIATIGLRSRVLATLIDWYKVFSGDETTWRFNSGNSILLAEQVVLIVLGLLACLAGGALVSLAADRLRPRRRVDPAAL